VVAVDPRTTSAEEALRLADDAMYAVKRSRRAATGAREASSA
jgi:diguanylate cyclase